MDELTNVMKLMISKLVRMDKWGGAHTELINLTKGLPTYFTASKKGKKVIEKAIKELSRREFILVKLSTGELHVSLNPRKNEEILGFYQGEIQPNL